ncbi:MAG: DMT family transporter [Angustibacter sp.]
MSPIGRHDGRTWRVSAQYAALACTWGTSFLFIAIGLEGLSPGQVVLGRLGAGAAALALICAATRQALPRDIRAWGHLLAVAVLLCVFPFLLFAWAQQHISSGIASILNATTPLMTMLVAVAALPAERPTRTRLAGLATGFLGVVIVLAPWHTGLRVGAEGTGDSLATWGHLACLTATLSYGVAFVYLRRFVSPLGVPAVPAATVQVGLAAVVVAALSPWLATEPARLTPRVLLAMAALGVLGTGLAYVWNTNVVNSWSATTASTVTYLTPLVGVLAGIVVLDERVSWSEPVGALVVVLGIAISQDRLGQLASARRSAVRADTWRGPSDVSNSPRG